jgi:colicin import membrane protein
MEGNGLDGMKWGPVIAVSILFHAALFSALIYFPESFSIRKPAGMFNVVQVELVSPPGGAVPSKETSKSKNATPTKSKSKKSISVPPKKTTRRLAPVQRKKKPVVVAKRTVKKKTAPVKKKEVSASELIDRAIKKIDRKVKAEEKKVSRTPAVKKGSHLDRALAGVEARARAGAGEGVSGTGGVAGTVMQIYQSKVQLLIEENWTYPTALMDDDSLEAIVLLDVRRDGKIISFRFVSRSSDPVLDESVIRAIERSDPLPPFPEVYRRSHDEIEIRFNPKERNNS